MIELQKKVAEYLIEQGWKDINTEEGIKKEAGLMGLIAGITRIFEKEAIVVFQEDNQSVIVCDSNRNRRAGKDLFYVNLRDKVVFIDKFNYSVSHEIKRIAEELNVASEDQK